jgi:hypothetical protein
MLHAFRLLLSFLLCWFPYIGECPALAGVPADAGTFASTDVGGSLLLVAPLRLLASHAAGAGLPSVPYVFTVLNSCNFWCPCCCWRPVVFNVFLSFLLLLLFMLFASVLVAAVAPVFDSVLVDPDFITSVVSLRTIL